MLKAVCIALLSVVIATAAVAKEKSRGESAPSDVEVKIIAIRPAPEAAVRVKMEINNRSSKSYYIAACDSPARISELYSQLEIANADGTWREVAAAGRPSFEENTAWWMQVRGGESLEVDYVFTPTVQGVETGANTRVVIFARDERPSMKGKEEEAHARLVSPAFVVPAPSATLSHHSHANAK